MYGTDHRRQAAALAAWWVLASVAGHAAEPASIVYVEPISDVEWLEVDFLQEDPPRPEPRRNATTARSRRSRSRRTRAPSMIGDFFGGTFGGGALITNFSVRTVHHRPSFTDLHAIVEGPPTTFAAGPFFETGSTSLGDTVTGLPGGFIGVKTTDTVSIAGADNPPSGVALTDVSVYAVGLPETVETPSLSTGGAVLGRAKVADNTSPLPQHRVYFNYSYYDNVALTTTGVAVNRFTPGVERAFLDERASLDVRFPMGATLSSDIVSGGATDLSHGEFGNIALTSKALLAMTESGAVSAGLQVTLPTANATRVLAADSTELVKVANESVHLMPFLGVLYTPNDRFFAQSFVQFDFDANGNTVLLNKTGQGLVRAGKINDTTFLYVDASLGWRLYESPQADAWVTTVTPMLELHYNRSLTGTDAVSAPGFLLGGSGGSFEVLNLVVGSSLEIANSATVLVGYTAPLGGGADQEFDGELRVSVTRPFGSQ